MKQFAFVVALCISLQLTSSQAAADPSPGVQDHANISAFSTSSLHGAVKYHSVYSVGKDQSVYVTVVTSRPARLDCLDYQDFKFDLTTASGAKIISADTRRLGGATVQRLIGPVGVWTGPGREPCTQPSRLDGAYDFSLSALYPHLAPGTYRLVVTIDPEDGSILPKTSLPAISFEVQAPSS